MAAYKFLTLILLAGLSSVEPARILSIFPFPGPSQYIFGSALLKGLAERGHEITSISTFPQKKPLKNFRDIPVMENFHSYDDLISEMTEAKEKPSFLEQYLDLANVGVSAVTNVYENPRVKSLMETEKFDLVIVEIMGTEAFLGLGEHFKVPVIAVSTFGTMSFLDYLVGNPSPLSYIPHMALPYGNHMSLTERIANVVISTAVLLCSNYLIQPHQEKIYNKYFPSATMSLDEARKNVSLVLLNTHFTLSFPRPFVTNMIEVGGLHIKQKPDALPEYLQKILDESTEGAIYFSMGSNVKSKDLPAETLQIFLEVFRELKHKVLWKFESEDLPNKPDNVLIQKWFPQPSVLAHPNVKLFISHGGFLSTTETIFHAKPIVGIPVLADQFMNVKNAVREGYSLSLDLKEITKEAFKNSIEEILQNPKYTQAVQRLSKFYRDQPMTPMDTAIYWVEYVLRHKGATHMRNAGVTLNFWQYHNIDVFIILSLSFLLFVYVLFGAISLCRKLITKLYKTKTKSKTKRQ